MSNPHEKTFTRREFGLFVGTLVTADASIGLREHESHLDIDSIENNNEVEQYEIYDTSNDISLWFSPHQDDELLTLGNGILRDINHGYNVHVVLCTDGGASGVLTELQRLLPGNCEQCGTTHGYNISQSLFISSRDAEFFESCQALGVASSNIHIYYQENGTRVPDGQLSESTARTLVQYYHQLYPNAHIRAISPLSGLYTDETQHVDHNRLAKAIARLQQEGIIDNVEFFIEPYLYDNPVTELSVSSLTCCDTSSFYQAANAYRYFNPANDRYAVGRHSMHTEFNDLTRVMVDYRYPSKLGSLVRYGGDSRYDTMKSAVLGTWSTSTHAIIATGENYPDALSAAALAGVYDAPILLTASASLSEQTAECLSSLNVSHVVIVGGTSAVSPTVEAAISNMGIDVTRIAGAYREETACLISQAVYNHSHSDTCIVVTGDTFPDALSIAPYAYKNMIPIYLAHQGSLLSATIDSIDSCNYTTMIVVGGTDVVNDSVASQCGITNMIRIEGLSRYETCANVALYATAHNSVLRSFSICKGTDFPDALVAGPCAGRRGSVVLIVNEHYSDYSSVINLIKQHRFEVDIDSYSCYAYGDEGALSDQTAQIIVLAATDF